MMTEPYEHIPGRITASSTLGVVFETTVWVHQPWKCDGEFCSIHNPSDHPMRDWEWVMRLEKEGLIERTCPHGIGHPDPDSLAYHRRTALDPEHVEWMEVHGCDGCCRG